MAILTVNELHRALSASADEQPHHQLGGRPRRARQASRVLIIGEDASLRRQVVNELMSSDQFAFECFEINGPELSVEAYDKFRPEVVIAEAFFQRSSIEWRIALRPLMTRRPGVRVLVLDDRKVASRELHSAVLDFGSYITMPRCVVSTDRLMLQVISKLLNTAGTR